MKKSFLIKIICALVLLASIALGVHNASLFHPTKGFDGSGHIYYINYIAENKKIPPPTEYETHQPPLYYIISAVVLNTFKDPKSIQHVNIAILWMIIAVVGLGFSKIFKNKKQVLLGMLSLAALPMLNIFIPAVTNELFSTLWIISAIVSCIYIYYSKTQKELNKSFTFLLISLVFGIWTKISIIAIIPTVIVAIFLSLKDIKKSLIYSVIAVLIFFLAYAPVYFRAANTKSPSNIIAVASNFSSIRPLDFFYRLDWIPKIDMYTTQYYSLWGGAWNSFWSDGHNQITPFVPFHKKAFILWSLGFVLLPISLFGIFKQFKENRKITIIMTTLGLSMIGFFIFYNIVSNHYSAARLTYQMGIVLPYAFGIAAASKIKKLSSIIFLLLAIQFVTLISFFWIEPWWFVTSSRYT